MGVGPVTASALVATVGDFKQFRNGAQFGAWLDLTLRQNSSEDKNNVGSITKRGDMYLRMLLIQGVKSAVMTAHRRDDPISNWAHTLREKAGWQKGSLVVLCGISLPHGSGARLSLWAADGLWVGAWATRRAVHPAIHR